MKLFSHLILGRALISALLATLPVSGITADVLTRTEVTLLLASVVLPQPKTRSLNRDFRPLLASVAKMESRNDPTAESEKGALGLFQLIRTNLDHYGVIDPFDPIENTRAGAAHFLSYLNSCRQDVVLTLAAWNAGPANVFRRLQQNWGQSIYGQILRNAPNQLDPEKVKTDCSPSPWDARTPMSELNKICRERMGINEVPGPWLSNFYYARLHMERVPNFPETQNFVVRVVEDYCQHMAKSEPKVAGE